MPPLFWIGIAGLCGTIMRYGISSTMDQRLPGPFPAGTLAVNLAGCFLAGLVFGKFQSAGSADPYISAILLIGFLGGFTTFSAYGLQVLQLLRTGEIWTAIAYVTASNAAGLTLAWFGLRVGEHL